jgi:hypothetical protein
LATAVGTGTSSISASLNGITGSTVLTVTAATLQSIAVTPVNPSIAKGTTQQFAATGTYTDNSTQVLTGSVTWASATTSVATITAAGLATGVGLGTSTISATLGGISGSTVLTVVSAGTATVTVSTPSPSTYGQSISFSVLVSGAGPVPTGNVQFLIDGSNFGGAVLLTNGAAQSGTISTLPAGNHTITVNYAGDPVYAANTGSNTQQVNKAHLTVTADNKSMGHGDPVPTLTYSLTGFVNNENATTANVTGTVALSTTGTSSSPAGYYPITVGTVSLAAPNYDFPTTVNGTLTIQPKVVDVRVDWGSRSMSILGLNRDLPFINITAIDIIFSDNVNVTSANLALTGVNIPSYSFSQFNYNSTAHDATWTLPTALGVDRLMMALDNVTATPQAGTGPNIALGHYANGFNVLPGDVDGDGVVTSQDVVLVRNMFLGFGGTAVTIFGDLDGNGVVDINDYNAVRRRVGTKLP